MTRSQEEQVCQETRRRYLQRKLFAHAPEFARTFHGSDHILDEIYQQPSRQWQEAPYLRDNIIRYHLRADLIIYRLLHGQVFRFAQLSIPVSPQANTQR